MQETYKRKKKVKINEDDCNIEIVETRSVASKEESVEKRRRGRQEPPVTHTQLKRMKKIRELGGKKKNIPGAALTFGAVFLLDFFASLLPKPYVP